MGVLVLAGAERQRIDHERVIGGREGEQLCAEIPPGIRERFTHLGRLFMARMGYRLGIE